MRRREEMVEREQQRLEEEKEFKAMMNQRFEEEAEKMRKEREKLQSRPRLTEEQRKIRQLISQRNRNARIRAARAAKDEKYRERLEARSYQRDKGIRTPNAWLSELTAEEMKTRRAILQKASKERLNARRRAAAVEKRRKKDEENEQKARCQEIQETEKPEHASILSPVGAFKAGLIKQISRLASMKIGFRS